MYKSNSLLKQPDNTLQPLWRYLTVERLIEIIMTKSIFFSHITTMSDSYEGKLTALTRERLIRSELALYKGNFEAAHYSVNEYEKLREKFCINCWHMNSHESYLMWKVYGKQECAIETTYERLVGSFDNTTAQINGCQITYVDFEREVVDPGNVFRLVSHKDIPYSDEREFRLLFWECDLENQNIARGEKGIEIPVDVEMMIAKIHINPLAKSGASLDNLYRAISDSGMKIKTQQTKITEE